MRAEIKRAVILIAVLLTMMFSLAGCHGSAAREEFGVPDEFDTILGEQWNLNDGL